MNGGDAEILEVVDTCGSCAGIVNGRACFCKGKILALVGIRDTAVGSDGEISYMKLIDLHVGSVCIGVSCIRFPVFRVCAVKIEDHASLAVHAYGSCIGVNDVLVDFAVKVCCKGVVLAAEIAVCSQYPCTVYIRSHLCDLLSVAAVALSINVEFELLGSRSPYTEAGAAVFDGHTQIIACVGVSIFKLFAGEIIRHCKLEGSAVEGDGVVLGVIQFFCKLESAVCIRNTLIGSDRHFVAGSGPDQEGSSRHVVIVCRSRCELDRNQCSAFRIRLSDLQTCHSVCVINSEVVQIRACGAVNVNCTTDNSAQIDITVAVRIFCAPVGLSDDEAQSGSGLCEGDGRNSALCVAAVGEGITCAVKTVCPAPYVPRVILTIITQIMDIDVGFARSLYHNRRQNEAAQYQHCRNNGRYDALCKSFCIHRVSSPLFISAVEFCRYETALLIYSVIISFFLLFENGFLIFRHFTHYKIVTGYSAILHKSFFAHLNARLRFRLFDKHGVFIVPAQRQTIFTQGIFHHDIAVISAKNC